MPRIPRLLTRRPRPAAILAAGVAVLILGTLGALGASPATPGDFAPPTTSADLMGDSNRDGRVDESETRGSCQFSVNQP